MVLFWRLLDDTHCIVMEICVKLVDDDIVFVFEFTNEVATMENYILERLLEFIRIYTVFDELKLKNIIENDKDNSVTPILRCLLCKVIS